MIVVELLPVFDTETLLVCVGLADGDFDCGADLL